jgi:class 3 adenylate cyclase
MILGMETPAVQYAERDGRALAYQCWGVGAADYLALSEWPANADSVWEHPSHLRLWRLLGSLGRVIRFDRSGIGSSDRDPDGEADPRAWAEDAVAVMNEVGAEHVAVVAEGWATHAAIVLATGQPERVDRLALINGYVRWLRSDTYTIGAPQGMLDAITGHVRSHWGTGAVIGSGSPFGDEYDDFCARYERAAASRGTAVNMVQAAFRSDIGALVGQVNCPTMVAHSRDLSMISEDASRYLADHIVGAELVLGRSEAYGDLTSEAGQSLAAFLSGGKEPTWDRELAVVVFSDIVASTARLALRGDREWSGILEDYQSVVELQVKRLGGTVIKQTGDGHLLTFRSPGSAVSAVFGIRRSTRTLGLPLRFGMHMGEIETRPGGDIAGITVNTASRIAARAEPDEILASSVVADLLAGTGIDLLDRGDHELKGVPREWRLFSLSFSAADQR